MSPLRHDAAENTEGQQETRKFHSKVQQLLMDSVLRLNNSGSNKHAISAQHLASTTRLLTTNLQNRANIDTALRDLAMERLAQAVSAAMSANCIYGNKRIYLLYTYIKNKYILMLYYISNICYRRTIGTFATIVVSTFFNRMDITNLCN